MNQFNSKQDDLIKIEGSIDLKPEVHSKLLQIGFENIKDLNRRLNNSLEVIYNSERLKFEPSDYTDQSNYEVVELLNKYLKWQQGSGKHKDYHLNTFLQSAESRFNELMTDYHYIQITNGLKDHHKETIIDFITEFADFSPKGLLAEEEISAIQKQLNSYCNSLKMKFLTESEIESLAQKNAAEIAEISERVEEIESTESRQFALDFLSLPAINKIFKSGEIKTSID